jgi:hypothetical protein
MNIAVLIDAIVRQTSVLVAQLAVAGGRPSLAHTSNQIFIDVVRELKRQGVGNKVIADMFGMALRTYHDRVKRLEQEARYGGCSLWEAVLGYISDVGSVSQADLLVRFRNEDALTLRGVIKDLVDSGRVSKTGRSSAVLLRCADADALEHVSDVAVRPTERRVANLVWVAVSRLGLCSFIQVSEQVPSHEAELHRALALLVSENKLREIVDEAGTRYAAGECVIGSKDPLGWEAAMFDHYQAMVQALCARLTRGDAEVAAPRGGGSTYTFVIAEDHPLRDEVMGFLNDVRRRAEELRKRVSDHNREHPESIHNPLRVTTYVGQSARGPSCERQAPPTRGSVVVDHASDGRAVAVGG